jgi:hypothetical protein
LPVHTEITLDPVKLERLAGRYVFSPELALVVKRKGGHLAMQENDEPPAELAPEGELRFFSKTADDVVTFEIDSQGKAARLVIHAGGRSIPVKRAD